MKYVIDTEAMRGRLHYMWKRLRCTVTLTHLLGNHGVRCVGQQLTACKKCGKVWRVWP